MTWLTKPLVLDLLAITIDGLNQAFDRIGAEYTADDPGGNVHTPDTAPTPVTVPLATPDTTPTVQPDPTALLPEAQDLLRRIAQTEGTEWITDTLLPSFGTNTLTEVPADKLPDLITAARTHMAPAA